MSVVVLVVVLIVLALGARDSDGAKTVGRVLRQKRLSKCRLSADENQGESIEHHWQIAGSPEP